MTDEVVNVFIEYASDIRTAILDVNLTVLELKQIVNEGILLLDVSDKGEIIANIMLAHRHLEDARMRIGKAIQAYDGGASVYSR